MLALELTRADRVATEDTAAAREEEHVLLTNALTITSSLLSLCTTEPIKSLVICWLSTTTNITPHALSSPPTEPSP